MKSDADVRDTIDQFADMVYRLGLVYMHNKDDAEDVFQKVFVKYALCVHAFDSDEHKKAWLIRVTINCCRSDLRSAWKKRVDLMEEDPEAASPVREDYRDLWDAMGALDPKYRAVLYLHYFEGYKAAEISKILGKRENTVYSLLARGRERLKAELKEDGEY